MAWWALNSTFLPKNFDDGSEDQGRRFNQDKKEMDNNTKDSEISKWWFITVVQKEQQNAYAKSLRKKVYSEK